MRPHRLRLTAFGPFPGTVELDLDEVSGAGPFLLRGATGAGKTSLLDAVGYALFGRVPGSRGMKQLRSDHAAEGDRTSVELWATVAGRAVHVVRTPDQRRPRARGEGWTTDRASVTVRVARDLAALEADECEARYSGVQEANDELSGLVGMTHEQFVQVVLLPQGDFARFLRARDDERADVLRALFDTSRFGAVEQHLRRRRDETRDGLAAAQAAAATAAAAVAAHAGVDEPPTAMLSDWARELLDRADSARARARTVAGAALEQLTAARRRHDAARQRARLLAELRDAALTWQDLLAQAPAVRRRAVELEAADRAADVAGLHEAHLAAQARADDALLAARAEVGRVLPGGLPEHVTGDDPAVAREAVVDLAGRLEADVLAAVRAHADLEALGRDVRRLHELEVEVAGQRESLLAAQDAVAGTRARAEALPGRVAGLVDELGRARAEAAGAEGAARELDRWQHLAGLAADLAGSQEQVLSAEQADLDARRACRDAEQHLDELREARVAGMSGELAAELRPGTACRVCGATEHPDPAVGAGPSHDPQAEEAARAEASRLAGEAAAAAEALARLQARREDVHARLVAGAAPDVAVAALDVPGGSDGDDSPDLHQDLARRVDDARTRLEAVRAAEARAATTAASLEQARAEQEAAADAVAAAELVVAGLSAAVDASAEEQARLSRHLVDALSADGTDETDRADRVDGADGARGGPADPGTAWAERTGAAADRLAALRGAERRVSDLLTALEDVTRTGAAADTAARAAGWDGTAPAVSAARPRSWRETVRREVASHDQDLHAVILRAVRLGEELADGTGTGPAVAGLSALVLEAAGTGSAEGGPTGTGPVRTGAATVAGLVEAASSALTREREHEAQTAEAVARAEEQHEQAREEVARCCAGSDGLERAVPRLLAAERSTAPLRDRAEAARALADLCSGANDKGIPLSTYVLAAHLEHVVEAANQRLHGMSDGRYALVHVEEGEDRRRRAGLGLGVLDAWTGRRRPAGTLSGGETFLASLALALGLADVVTAEAGGVRIDALFVDEGFGTLDPDSLDRAMDVLDRLQEHGRMVGVVSHVGELAQRLPRQVLVHAGRGGSTVEVVAG